MLKHLYEHLQDFILGAFRPRLLPTGDGAGAPAPSENTLVTWADATVVTWGDGTRMTWSS